MTGGGPGGAISGGETTQRVVALLRAGVRQADVASRLKVSPGTVASVALRCRKAGIDLPQPAGAVRPAVARVRALPPLVVLERRADERVLRALARLAAGERYDRSQKPAMVAVACADLVESGEPPHLVRAAYPRGLVP